jgi:adenylate cyclase, class 2
MGFEVEVKYRLLNRDDLVQRLRERGAAPRSEIDQEDTYFSHPARDFAVTREAFRVRRTGDDNRITYKGPRHSGPTKTREEIEIRFSDGDEAHRQLQHLFANLGFVPIATISKRRTPYQLNVEGREIEVVLDQAQGLGAFAEIETIAPTPADLPAAQAAVLALSCELGLTEVEPRSYLRMALAARPLARTSFASSGLGAHSDVDSSGGSRPQTG